MASAAILWSEQLSIARNHQEMRTQRGLKRNALAKPLNGFTRTQPEQLQLLRGSSWSIIIIFAIATLIITSLSAERMNTSSYSLMQKSKLYHSAPMPPLPSISSQSYRPYFPLQPTSHTHSNTYSNIPSTSSSVHPRQLIDKLSTLPPSHFYTQ